MRYELAFVKGQAAKKWGDPLSFGRGDHGCRLRPSFGSAGLNDYRNRIPFGAMSPGFGGFGGAG
jgi:hypothetical protein